MTTQNIGDNGRSYEKNWAAHQELLAQFRAETIELHNQIAARDGISEELDRQRESAPPEEIKKLEDQLIQREAQVEKVLNDRAEIRKEIGELELQAGVEHASWLSNGLAPDKLDPTFDKKVADAPDKLDTAKELNEIVRGAEEFARLADSADNVTVNLDPKKVLAIALAFQAQSHGTPALNANEAVARQTYPAQQEQEHNSKDILEGMDKTLSRRPSRDELEEEAQNINKAVSADHNAPSNGPPASMEQLGALDRLHLQEWQDQQAKIEASQRAFDERHDRLNTDHALVRGLQDRSNEENDFTFRSLAERQGQEKNDLREGKELPDNIRQAMENLSAEQETHTRELKERSQQGGVDEAQIEILVKMQEIVKARQAVELLERLVREQREREERERQERQARELAGR